ncbi:uncharacterized protein LOC114319338, partial [Camellia sinensis]|uniref:uncharacterized protein LOC114319338 n=1 Tax=Camellia sinensis TaxID=4442 RepID=UPI00103619EA
DCSNTRFNALPIELKLQILEYIPFEELHPWFSALPIELKLQMLEYFSFEDVTRTGILSSTSNWSEHPQFILDKCLFEERGRWIEPDAIAWMQKVVEILNNHPKGPIRKFILHIPDMEFNWDRYINIWIPFLWSNGIKELSMDNWNIITYKFLLFSECYELTRLKLYNCAFHKSFGSFQNLRFLHLDKIAFGSDTVGDITLSTPSLVQRSL